MSAAASAKHENFVMSTSYTARAGRRQTTRSTLLMYVVHLGRLKAPRKAAGQMDLLTVPSADGVDSKVIQVEEAFFISLLSRPLRPFRYLKGRLEPARQLANPMASCRTHVPSRPERARQNQGKRAPTKFSDGL